MLLIKESSFLLDGITFELVTDILFWNVDFILLRKAWEDPIPTIFQTLVNHTPLSSDVTEVNFEVLLEAQEVFLSTSFLVAPHGWSECDH